jgi:hypothetical protein
MAGQLSPGFIAGRHHHLTGGRKRGRIQSRYPAPGHLRYPCAPELVPHSYSVPEPAGLTALAVAP